MIDTSVLIARSLEIQSKVNVLERLFKTCQLTNVGLDAPILNEMRYLSRALADVLFFQNQDIKNWSESLIKSEHAVHNAINDSVDSLITFVKSTLAELAQSCPKFAPATSSYGAEYLDVLKSIAHVDSVVVYSRGARTERYETYKSLSEENYPGHLDKIAAFALKLPEIEAIALRGDAPSEPNYYSDDALLQNIRNALTGQSDSIFSMALQPKYRTDVLAGSPTLIGAEALLRLSVQGLPISPTSFIPVAERGHLIALVDMWILKAALRTLNENPWIPRISVNVSVIELLSPSYANDVLEQIDASGVSPDRLELEVTEGCVISDISSALHLHKLSEKGVHISIDDFGTGQTKFDYLAKIPVNSIKIDRSLVLNHASAPDSYGVLLRAICAVGAACKIRVIAEAVETEAQVAGLTGLGITDFQGYYFGKPVPINSFIEAHRPSN